MKYFLFSNCTILHDELFFIGALGGLLGTMKQKDGIVTYLDNMKGFIPKETTAVVDFMDSFENKIYVVDSGGRDLSVFDLNSFQYQNIPLKCSFQPRINFVAFERYELKYYIFPKYVNKLLVFNIENNVITETSWCLRDIDEVQCACRVKNSVWLLPKDADIIYCYDLVNAKCKCYDLKRIVKNCVHAVYKSGCIYMLNMFGIIYIWNIEQMELKEITALETKHDEKESMSRMVCVEKKLILLPAYGNNIKMLYLSTGETEIYHEYPVDFLKQAGWLKFYGYCEDNNNYYFAMCCWNYLLKIEKQSGNLIWIKPSGMDSIGGRIMELLRNNIFFEKNFEITDLLEKNFTIQNHTRTACIGKDIYNVIAD